MFLFDYDFLFYFLAVTGRHFLGLRKPITRQTSRGKDPLQRGSGAQRSENAVPSGELGVLKPLKCLPPLL